MILTPLSRNAVESEIVELLIISKYPWSYSYDTGLSTKISILCPLCQEFFTLR